MAVVEIRTNQFRCLLVVIILKCAGCQHHSDRHLDDGYGITQDYGNTYALSQDLYNPDPYNSYRYPSLPNGEPAPTYASNQDPYAELQGTRESETGDQDTWDGYAGDQAATTPAAEQNSYSGSYDPYGARGHSGNSNYDPYGGRRSETYSGGNEVQTDTNEQVTTPTSSEYDPYQTPDPYAQDKERNQAGGHDLNTDGGSDRDNYNTVDPYAYATTTAIPWAGNYGDRHTQDQSVSGSSGYNPYASGRESASGSSNSGYDPYNRDTVDRQPATPDPYQYPETTTAGYDSYGSVAATPYDPYAHYRTTAPNYDNYETTTQNPYDNSYYQTQAPNNNYGSQYGNNYHPYERYQSTTVNYWTTPGYDRQDPYGSRYQSTTQNYWSNRNYGGQAEASTQSPYQYDRQTTQSYYGGYNYDNQNAYTTASPYSYYTTANPYDAYGNQYQTTPQYNNQGYGSGYGTGGSSHNNHYGNGYGQGSYSSSNSYSSYGNGNYAATTPVPTCVQYNPVNGNGGGNGGYNPPSSNAGESCCTFYRNGMTCQECTTINGGFFARRTSCSSSWSFGKK